MSDAGGKRNRLAFERSPYLLQHAGNPVDWRPWGDEAFEVAEREDKPVFLSIGYATCHWCHVMERESFTDPAVAQLLNDHFVPVKVDREERPDVDAAYMEAVQTMTGHGGWPLSVFLAPDRKPFFGGTYYPPEDRHGRPGFSTLLRAVADAWANRREEIVKSAGDLVSHLTGKAGASGETPGEEVLRAGVEHFAGRFDAERGGFGRAPKFPRPHALDFLLAAHARFGDDRALRMVVRTLEAMAAGGIRDHLGGGFHRYSTDREWLVPHFEKMLYDQAQLLRTFVDAHLVVGAPQFADVAREIAGYVLRDLRLPGGAFGSAEDADSEGEEGKFYVFTMDEIRAALGDEDGAWFAAAYGVKAEGNHREEATGRPTGTNILHRPAGAPEWTADEAARLARLREKLLAVRNRRVRPLFDDKVLADWNGLLIGALARAGRALGEPAYVEAAERAADFVLAELRPEGRLLHRWREGEAAIPAFLDDFAFLAEGLLDLYETTFDPRRLADAKALLDEALDRFADPAGGFFLSPADGEAQFVRTKEAYDGATPSGNSTMARTLLRMGRLTMDARLVAAGQETIQAFAGSIAAAPEAFPAMLLAADFAMGPGKEIVLAGDPADPELNAMRAFLDRRYAPRAVRAHVAPGPAGAAIRELVPFLARLKIPETGAAAYVCENYTCRTPVHTAAALTAL